MVESYGINGSVVNETTAMLFTPMNHGVSLSVKVLSFDDICGFNAKNFIIACE